MKLSIVIICWNDWKVIENCLSSIFMAQTKTEFEVIVYRQRFDGRLDRTIRAQFPAGAAYRKRRKPGVLQSEQCRHPRGRRGLHFDPQSQTPSCIAGSLDRWMEFADQHPEAGGFGCKVLNPDGTFQGTARPFPTVRRALIAALGLRRSDYLGRAFVSDKYVGWNGDREEKSIGSLAVA